MKNTLKTFVENLRENWQKEKETFLKAYNLVLESSAIDESTKDTEQITEEFTATQLEKIGYTTTLVKGSQTPSDVWAIKECEEYIHLMLVQVKGTITENNPKPLNDNQILVLRYFTKYVLNYFFKYNNIFANKIDLKKPIFISNGYIGLKIKSGTYTPFGQTPFTFWYFTKDKEIAMKNKNTIFLPHYFK